MTAFLVLSLILLFFFPALFLPLLLVIGFFLLLYIPLKFTFNSVAVLLAAPGQIYRIATDVFLRKNHALEHATINVLEERYGRPLPLSGFAQKNGYFLQGGVDAWEVEEAAREGLLRLQQGEKNLAIHKRCGTTLLAANIISAVLFLLLLFTTGIFSFFHILLAIILANLIGPFLGIIFQRLLTTSVNVKDMVIQGVEYRKPPHFSYGLWFFVRTVKLRTVGKAY